MAENAVKPFTVVEQPNIINDSGIDFLEEETDISDYLTEENCFCCGSDVETLEELSVEVAVRKVGQESTLLCRGCFKFFGDEFGAEATIQCLDTPSPLHPT